MTGIKGWMAPAVALCVALAAGCDASRGDADDNGSDPAGSKEDRADRLPAAPIDVADGSIAAYEAGRDRVYVASDDVVERIELPDGAPTAHFAAGGPILALAVTERELLVLAALDGDEVRLSRIGHDGGVGDEITFAMTLPTPQPHPMVRSIDPDTVLVVSDRGESAVVVELGTGEAHASEPAVWMFVYQEPGVGVVDGRAFLPSAYPGEVVETAPSRDDGLVEVRRIQVSDDWLHDVAMIDADRALVAGHLRGIGVVEMVETGPFEGAPYVPISDLLWAYSLVGDGLAYSAAGASVVCIALDDLTSWTLEVAELDAASPGESNRTAPLGERAPGRALIHQSGTAIVEIDCDAAAR